MLPINKFPWPYIFLLQPFHLFLTTKVLKGIIDTTCPHFLPPWLLSEHPPPQFFSYLLGAYLSFSSTMSYSPTRTWYVVVPQGLALGPLSPLWDNHTRSLQQYSEQMTCKYVSLVPDLFAKPPDSYCNSLLDIFRTCQKYIKINMSITEFLIVLPKPSYFLIPWERLRVNNGKNGRKWDWKSGLRAWS